MKLFSVKSAAIILMVTTVSACASSQSSRNQSRAEAQPAFHFAKPVSLVLISFDSNDDRSISRDELNAGLDREWQLVTANTEKNFLGPIDFGKWVTASFGSDDLQFSHFTVDINANGSISEDEFDAALIKEFDKADADSNGVVSRAELVSEFSPRNRGGRNSEAPAEGGRGEGGERRRRRRQ